MRQNRIFFSPISLTMTLVLLTGLGATVWRSGGKAFSPGDLSAKSYPDASLDGFSSHADFEKECSLCHQPLITTQAELCVVCHTRVAGQIESGEGVHGNSPEVLRCAECHSDHQGRDFDPLWDALRNFKHADTDFSLNKHLIDYGGNLIECTACHVVDQGFEVIVQGCLVCHAGQAVDFMTQHILDFGDSCLGCHDGVDRMTGFDHLATDFPLEGNHTLAQCVDCHKEGRFDGTTQACQVCHLEPEVHQSLFSAECGSCHTEQAWKPAIVDGQPFEHVSQTGFSLVRHNRDYAEQPLTCLTCHLDDVQSFELGTCVTCHTGYDAVFMDQHVEFFGADCLDCHDGVDRMSDFDHETVFPLAGRHASSACETCHVIGEAGRVFKDTPTACFQCHVEPQIHAGFFGLQCEYCHSTDAWVPAQLSQHTFPLSHGEQGVLECQLCHTDSYTSYTCYGCHEHQPEQIAEEHVEEGVSLAELPSCTKCHPQGEEMDED
ncbi:MAG: hypothetical protein JJE12_11860 [Anaerolineales bacterium]|nr:hypothetical protein [Anaerolineales bacterium]